MHYRPEIDGLRALAVLPVILFHGGIQVFGGGFVGVDIFFVISGYLITSILLVEIAEGKFSFSSFYERRARRILPALFFMMIFCMPFSWLLMMPHELKGFSQSLVAVSTFSANVYFWISTGYFETVAELRPLLHTWSLAVEEQFYLLFPVMLLLGLRWGKAIFIFSIVIISLISLILAQHYSEVKPAFAFYLLPTRAWELLVGSVIAFYFHKNQHRISSSILTVLGSILGILLIVFSIFGYSKFTPYPSFYTISPVLGTALFILFASRENWVGKIFSSEILVSIGLISYSLYLWHQPVFVYTRLWLGSDIPYGVVIILLLVLALLSYFSWRFIEKPFRDRSNFSRAQIFSFSIIGGLIFISIGLFGQFTSGFLNDKQKAVLAYNEYQEESKRIGRVGSCFLDVGDPIESFETICIGNNSDDSVFIWGDSHAAALSFGLRQVYKNVTQFTSTGCPPLINVSVSNRPLCKKINTYIANQVKILKPKNIFLYANWGIYDAQKPIENLAKTIDYIHLVSPQSKVTILGGTPQFLPSLPTYMFKQDKNLLPGELLPTYLYEHISVMDLKLSALATDKKINFLSLLNLVCQKNQCQITADYEGVTMPIIWDYGHLTAAGSLLLAEKIKKELQNKLIY